MAQSCPLHLQRLQELQDYIFVDGTDEILYSEDGCIQGDPIAMLLYSVGVKLLFVVVKEKVAEVFNDKGEKLFQVLFADDSSAAGKLETVLAWVKALVKEGPKYGYYPEPSKSVLVVKEGKKERAREVFAEYPDREMVSHHRFLGGCIGASAGVEAYAKK